MTAAHVATWTSPAGLRVGLTLTATRGECFAAVPMPPVDAGEPDLTLFLGPQVGTAQVEAVAARYGFAGMVPMLLPHVGPQRRPH